MAEIQSSSSCQRPEHLQQMCVHTDTVHGISSVLRRTLTRRWSAGYTRHSPSPRGFSVCSCLRHAGRASAKHHRLHQHRQRRPLKTTAPPKRAKKENNKCMLPWFSPRFIARRASATRWNMVHLSAEFSLQLLRASGELKTLVSFPDLSTRIHIMVSAALQCSGRLASSIAELSTSTQ